MKSFFHALLFAASFAAVCPLNADEHALEIITVGNDKFLRWHGQADRTYFIQVSDPNDHLRKWTWAPIIETGNDEAISYEVDGTANKGFFRLWFSDEPTTDPDGDDFDYDGLSNWDEVNTHQTNPLEWDSDFDGLPDDWEINHGLDPNDDGSTDPANGADGDPDGDGLTNQFEYWYTADPNLADTDSDGLNDFDEVFLHGTYPDSSDTDYDGLGDYAEIFTHGTNPWDWDSDDDTLDDGAELLTHGTNPLEMDTDGDWMWDDYEIANILDPNDAADGLLDADSDTLANQLEFIFIDQGYDPFTANNAAVFPWTGDPDWDGMTTQLEFVTHLTNPRQPDTDGDGMDDAWEIAHGFNAKLNNRNGGPANHHPNADPDSDGLTNAQEAQLGTNPFANDTDGDGVSDGDEDNQGSNPNDPNDSLPPPNGTVAADVTFGDHSGSHSEKYRVQFTPLEGDAGGVRFRTNRDYGTPQTDTFRLPKGAKYKVEIIHVGTNPKYRGSPRPDYDYQLEIDVSGNCLVVADPQGIMGYHNESNPLFATGKDATLYVPLFEWVTPKASPVTAPDDAGDGQNEFTYNAAAAGVLTIDLKVLVKPTGTAGVTGHDGVKFSDRCVYTLPSIAGSTFAWDAANPGGKSATSGEHLFAKATYTTLPALNTEFGLKQAEFKCDGHADTLPKGDFEVFFPKEEKNHPGIGAGTTPNWYYYWAGTAVPGYDLTSGTYSYAPGAADDYARYNSNPSVPHYTIHGPASAGHETYTAAGLTVDRKGIDTLACTLVHEKTHWQVDQNWLAGGIWHGKANTDITDELPDEWEDANAALGFDKTKPTSFPTFPYGDDEEVYCERAAYGTTGDASKDWSNPGKQSKTIF